MINQREIADLVRRMRPMELLELILKYPHFITDGYSFAIVRAHAGGVGVAKH